MAGGACYALLLVFHVIVGVRFFDGTFEQWQARGKDVHSVYADPQFVDPDGRDFRLRPTSPALALGFRPIDLSTVGPRAPTGPATRPAGG